MIILEHLCKSFDGRAVLADVSAVFATGETVCVMAPSGAGKTTLCNVLLGLVKPDGGTVVTVPNALRFSAAFQEERLCPQLTAAANVRFACGAVPQKTLTQAFAAVGLAGDDLQKPVAELSGGQQRRVSLVRAMLAPSDAVLLDEPFKGLDAAAKASAVHFVKESQGARTLLCVTHEPEDANLLAGRIFTLTKG